MEMMFLLPMFSEGNATLECVAVGNPPPTMSFRKLRGSAGAAGGNSMMAYSRGSLHLVNAGLGQEGEYICEAHNGIGDAVSTLATVVLNSKFDVST